MVQWRALALLLLVLVGIDVALPVGRRPTESRYDTHGVNCSLLGDCYNISGAENSDPHLPTGVDLNGLYAKTSQLCFGQPSWQQAAGGPVVYCLAPAANGTLALAAFWPRTHTWVNNTVRPPTSSTPALASVPRAQTALAVQGSGWRITVAPTGSSTRVSRSQRYG